jgi:hypothetical protein
VRVLRKRIVYALLVTVATIVLAGISYFNSYSQSFRYLVVPPGDAPPVEIPSAMILFVIVVSIGSIILIVQKGIHQQNVRKGQEMPFGFAGRFNTTSVAIILVLMGTLAPCCMTYRNFTDPVTLDVYFQLNLTALLWSLWLEANFWRFDLPSLPVLAYSLVLLVFYLVYVYEVIEYCYGQTSWTKTVLAWLISQLPLLVTIIPEYQSGVHTGAFFYAGPTFITLVFGLIIMKIANPKPSGEPLWKRKD